jgi:hypothetical protein
VLDRLGAVRCHGLVQRDEALLGDAERSRRGARTRPSRRG